MTPRFGEVAMLSSAEQLLGFEVVTAFGSLGVVVEPGTRVPAAAVDSMLVQGGVSRSLFYHVPLAAITSVSHSRAVVTVEIDGSDFSPRLREDGSVDLHVH